jgi:hypothetical protein
MTITGQIKLLKDSTVKCLLLSFMNCHSDWLAIITKTCFIY